MKEPYEVLAFEVMYFEPADIVTASTTGSYQDEEGNIITPVAP